MCVFIMVFGATENGAVLQQDNIGVAEWLKMEHFSSQVILIQAVEGKVSSYAYLSVCRWLFCYNYCIKWYSNYFLFISDNEIDGEAFLLLSDEQIKSIVKPIGSQMKLISKKKSI